ncbi:hypothetical protein QW131_16785 [Roseibium salinum]|nr:hypothetical protein [Roseibium salinum]
MSWFQKSSPFLRLFRISSSTPERNFVRSYLKFSISSADSWFFRDQDEFLRAPPADLFRAVAGNAGVGGIGPFYAPIDVLHDQAFVGMFHDQLQDGCVISEFGSVVAAGLSACRPAPQIADRKERERGSQKEYQLLHRPLSQEFCHIPSFFGRKKTYGYL